MAIARGAGTEIIRTALFEDVSSTDVIVIYGVQHHIYTVLSITCHPRDLNASGDYIRLKLRGYDSSDGTSTQNFYIFEQEMAEVNTTFVWNDKFSFNGYEPVDFTAGLDATKQDAIADQGSSVSQYLKFHTDSASTTFHVSVTFIDQNNA